jgi:hypothetical protein
MFLSCFPLFFGSKNVREKTGRNQHDAKINMHMHIAFVHKQHAAK